MKAQANGSEHTHTLTHLHTHIYTEIDTHIYSHTCMWVEAIKGSLPIVWLRHIDQMSLVGGVFGIISWFVYINKEAIQACLSSHCQMTARIACWRQNGIKTQNGPTQ